MKKQIYNEHQINGLLDKITEVKSERDKWARMAIKLVSLLKVTIDSEPELLDAIEFKNRYILEFDQLIEGGIRP